ncbi:uncharacterized protein LOC134230925 [Saccostrea cucullata]|uniref:uncharacterized protein LOC134230925 n=1 Tax=Saccostrea cuccullata TaxID=36930 RepID=UPI002ED1EBD7
MVYGFEEPETEDKTSEYYSGPGIVQVLTMEGFDQVFKAEKFVAYEDQLLMLAKTKIDDSCLVKGCSEQVVISTKCVGSALTLFGWCSQPVLNRGLHSGDLVVSVAVLCSGNNFSKVELMGRIMNLHLPSQSAFTRIQRTYLVPAIEEKWEEHQEIVRNELVNRDIVVLGDGRMDSQGHCAQYCTYTMIEMDSKKIVALETLDKQETGKKSTSMEKSGFQRALDDVQSSLNVKEVVTDAHLQIGALMKRQYSHIKHSHDIWHAAKNLGKKIIAAGQEKSCKELLQWSTDIVNHFWHCCKVASTYEEFLDVWVGVLHHVQNEHEWGLSYGRMAPGACYHEELNDDRDKSWIEKGSPAHSALTKNVLDKRFLNNNHYYLNFRNTADLEIFNNHILMYASKRISYSPPVYRARNILAALDYNYAVDLPTATHKDGAPRYFRTYSKKSGRWTVFERKVKKTYSHINDIFLKVLRKRFELERGMHHPAELAERDPRRISRVIAPKSPPPTVEIALQKKSRFE